MSKYLYLGLALTITLFIVAIFFFAPKTMAFDLFGDSCSGNAANSPTCQQAQQQQGDPIAGPGGIINTAANIIAVITGIAAVVMIIIGGLTIVTSGGNAERNKLGRREILGSVIAVVIVALAWTITSFVINLVQ
jgi:hypothetical protein